MTGTNKCLMWQTVKCYSLYEAVANVYITEKRGKIRLMVDVIDDKGIWFTSTRLARRAWRGGDRRHCRCQTINKTEPRLVCAETINSVATKKFHNSDWNPRHHKLYMTWTDNIINSATFKQMIIRRYCLTYNTYKQQHHSEFFLHHITLVAFFFFKMWHEISMWTKAQVTLLVWKADLLWDYQTIG